MMKVKIYSMFSYLSYLIFRRSNYSHNNSSNVALEIYNEHNDTSKHDIREYNSAIFDNALALKDKKTRRSVFKSSDEPSDAELRFRKYIEVKQKSKKIFIFLNLSIYYFTKKFVIRYKRIGVD